jgi:hypothetical protein
MPQRAMLMITPEVGGLDTERLLAALDGSSQMDLIGLVKQQLEAQPNPHSALLLRLLEQRRIAEATSREKEQTDAEPPAVAEAAVDMTEDIREVQSAVDALYAELERLREHAAALAAGIGACPDCFGDDPGCEQCMGRGAPGSRRPQPEAFKKYVLPAFVRARAIDHGRDRRAHAGGPPARFPVNER